jgi:post-segregation antitoxin (ccd killing protein)
MSAAETSAAPAQRRAGSYQGRIDGTAKLSVSLPDDLVQDLRAVAHDNVSAFVAAAVQSELDRRRLLTFVAGLEDELGAADETEVARYAKLFAAARPEACDTGIAWTPATALTLSS